MQAIVSIVGTAVVVIGATTSIVATMRVEFRWGSWLRPLSQDLFSARVG